MLVDISCPQTAKLGHWSPDDVDTAPDGGRVGVGREGKGIWFAFPASALRKAAWILGRISSFQRGQEAFLASRFAFVLRRRGAGMGSGGEFEGRGGGVGTRSASSYSAVCSKKGSSSDVGVAVPTMGASRELVDAGDAGMLSRNGMRPPPADGARITVGSKLDSSAAFLRFFRDVSPFGASAEGGTVELDAVDPEAANAGWMG